MRVLWIANIPSPYRVNFYNFLGEQVDLTVLFERKSAADRDKKWTHDQFRSFKGIFLDAYPIGTDKSISFKGVSYLRKNKFDIVVVTGYSSPTVIAIIEYCKYKKIPYWLEYDGGFNRHDPFSRRILKKFLLRAAFGHLTTCDEHIEYLKGLGIPSEKIFKYPFTSISETDIIAYREEANNGKEYYRKKLDLQENKIIVSIGQFIYRKGFDLLIEAAKELSDVGVYIIGGEPTAEYLSQAEGYNNIHFIGFKSKGELAEYYCAADLMVLLTREDIWGLVVNEAMAYGVPVITTDCCIAGLELVKDGENGFIVPGNNYHEAVTKINVFFKSSNLEAMSIKCLETAEEYTIEKMVLKHMEVFSHKAIKGNNAN